MPPVNPTPPLNPTPPPLEPPRSGGSGEHSAPQTVVATPIAPIRQPLQKPVTSRAYIEPPKSSAKKPMGPMVGIFIIVILLAFGGLYFWGAQLNKEAAQEQLPFIPGDSI